MNGLRCLVFFAENHQIYFEQIAAKTEAFDAILEQAIVLLDAINIIKEA